MTRHLTGAMNRSAAEMSNRLAVGAMNRRADHVVVTPKRRATVATAAVFDAMTNHSGPDRLVGAMPVADFLEDAMTAHQLVGAMPVADFADAMTSDRRVDAMKCSADFADATTSDRRVDAMKRSAADRVVAMNRRADFANRRADFADATTSDRVVMTNRRAAPVAAMRAASVEDVTTTGRVDRVAVTPKRRATRVVAGRLAASVETSRAGVAVRVAMTDSVVAMASKRAAESSVVACRCRGRRGGSTPTARETSPRHSSHRCARRSRTTSRLTR